MHCNTSKAVSALAHVEVDQIVLNTYRRKYARASVKTLEEYSEKALAAWEKRQLQVVITSASFEGGATSGQIVGDPLEIMRIMEILIAEKMGQIKAKDVGGADSMSHSVDFRKRRVEP